MPGSSFLTYSAAFSSSLTASLSQSTIVATMSRAGILSLIFAFACIVVFLFTTTVTLAIYTDQPNSKPDTQFSSTSIVKSPIDIYQSSGETLVKMSSDLGTADARPVIVDNFLAKNHSPMEGMGSAFVFEADRYGIDWKLLPAIAFQESSLGKTIPKGSYNPFGWAVYTGNKKGARFTSWQDAIEKVAAGIKERYISKGLTTPEAIMTRYTPGSDGSWAYAIHFAMDEMSQ